MSTRHFTLTLTATVHLDDEVIDHVREKFYDLLPVEATASAIGFNLVQGVSLSQIDGLEDLPDELARLVDLNVENVVEDVETDSQGNQGEESA